jgi:radical SAM superfamily enzyme YgiQ (UPF0313 family)
MKKRVELIALPSPFAEEPAMNPPLGLAYIAAATKKGRHAVHVVDFATMKVANQFTSHQLNSINLHCDVYGISVLTAQVHWLKQVVAYIRKYNDNCYIVMGGPHATTCPEECLRMGADFVVRGDGEAAFREFLDDKQVHKIKGLCFLDNDILRDGGRAMLDDINDVPFPARALFDMSKYKRMIGDRKAAHIVTLRGCPYNCAYCDKESVGRKVRFRSPRNVLNEVDTLRRDFGIEALVIYDDIFTLNKGRLKELCRGFHVRKLRWRCWSRADMVDENVLQRMKNSGMTSITMGIESGDDDILKALGKKLTAKDNYDALQLCRRLRIPVRCSLIYGGPNESIHTIKKTIKMIEETQPDEWNLSVMSPVPGSAIWKNPAKYGLLFNQGALSRRSYIDTNRFGESGVGTIYAWPVRGSKDEYVENLKFFVSELERVCPRKKIQDTIQTINTDKVES